MAEGAAGADAGSGPGGETPAPGALTPEQLERLTYLVYCLLKTDILRGRERRGELTARDWR